MENGKNALDGTEDNKLHTAEITEHATDYAQSIASMDMCSQPEIPGALSVSFAEELRIESKKSKRDEHIHFSINEKVIQGQKMEGSTVHALCAVGDSKDPCVEVKELAMIESGHIQFTASTSTSGMIKTPITPSMIDTHNSSTENNRCGKDVHQHGELSVETTPHIQGLDRNRAVCGVMEDISSHILPTDEDSLQEHGIEQNIVDSGAMGNDELNNFSSNDIGTVAETLVEQPCLIFNDKKHDIKENDYQHSCFVSLIGNEENKHMCDDLPCYEVVSDQENTSAIHVETNADNFLNDDELKESHNRDCEKGGLGEDKEHKSGANNPLLEVSEKVQCHCQLLNVTDCRGTFSHAESCEQGNCRLEIKDTKASDSCSLAVCSKPEEAAIHDEHAKHNLSAVGGKTSGSLNALLSQDNVDYANISCISDRFLTTEGKALSGAQGTESGNFMSSQDICDNVPGEGPTELQSTATDVKSENDITNGSLEDLTCVLDTLKISNLAFKESVGDEECQLAAGQDPSMKSLSQSPSISCSEAKVGGVDDKNLHVQASESNKLEGINCGIDQMEEGTASNESQLHGYPIDKDGGSSMDSTAGTEWKPQGTNGCIAAEDEEASNTGGEDSASSPACLQPSTQQRKKININHQFVREIVKIQHDREQYDREHTERQIQAHQTVASAQLGVKSLDSKGHKIHASDSKQLRSENRVRGLKDHGDDRQSGLQQKHATRINKSLSVQAKEGSSHQKNTPQESREHETQIFLQGQDLLGAKEHHGKTGRGRQQRSMSIYRPPVVRDSLTAWESETSYHQSGTYMMSNSPDSSASSVSELHAPIVGSPSLFDDAPKVVRSSSGESSAHNRETQPEQGKPGMGIKVTFDTERQQRHIEFSDFPGGHTENDQGSLMASHSSSGFGMSRSLVINPLPRHPSQESKSSYLDKRQAGLGETPSRANDHYFTQADRSSSLKGSSPAEPPQFRGKMGKASGNNVERKNSFFEQVDNNVVLHNSSAWLHMSPSIGNNGPNIYSDNVRHAEGHARDMRTPSALLQGFSTPSSRKFSSLGPSYKGEPLGATSYSSPHVRRDEPNQTPGNFQASLQAHQFNVSRSKPDLKGKQRLVNSSDGSKKKRDLQLRNSIKESGSPFQAMMKDTNRPQFMYSSPAPHSSGDHSSDTQGFGMSWDMEDSVHSRNQDSSYEGLKRTQSDASRKGSAQNLQAQSSPLPSRESFFSTMPMQEKWGDIVDDQYDSYDYLQIKREGERESYVGNLAHGSNTQSSASFIDAASLKPEKQTLNLKQRKYGHSETSNLQKSKTAFELLQDRSPYETPVRKSVFERLGPQNNFKESILGPPPRILDSRGVLRASPDVIIGNTPPGSTFKSFDTGFHGSQQVAHLPGMMHDTGDNINNEGREVVVQAYTELKQRRSKRELYVPRRGS